VNIQSLADIEMRKKGLKNYANRGMGESLFVLLNKGRGVGAQKSLETRRPSAQSDVIQSNCPDESTSKGCKGRKKAYLPENNNMTVLLGSVEQTFFPKNRKHLFLKRGRGWKGEKRVGESQLIPLSGPWASSITDNLSFSKGDKTFYT